MKREKINEKKTQVRSFLFNAAHLGLIILYISGGFYEPFIGKLYSIFGELTEGVYIIGVFFVCFGPHFYMKRIEEKREFREMMERINKRERAFKRKKRKKKK